MFLDEEDMEDYFDELYRNYDRDFNKALDNKEFKNLKKQNYFLKLIKIMIILLNTKK